MILSGSAIVGGVKSGSIVIRPFQPEQVNPNSYNYRLGRLILERRGIESREEFVEHDLKQKPLLLEPSRLYLGHTFERIGSEKYVTLLGGRSSMGRLGLFLNYSADLGHVGAVHCWTLELKVVQPLVVHWGMQVGQATFWTSLEPEVPYEAGYAMFDLPTPAVVEDRLR